MNCLGPAVLVFFAVIPLFAQTTPEPMVTDNARKLVLDGMQLLTGRHLNEALETFRQARAVAPHNIDAIIGLARTESLNPNLYAQAIADYGAALSIRPEAEIYGELAFVFLIAKEYPAAITASKKALNLNRELLAAEMVYGSALSEMGDLDNAISVFSKACVQSRATRSETNGNCGSWVLFPFLPGTEVSVASARAWAYFKKGDCLSLSLAERDFIEAQSFEPGNQDLHERLGSVLMAEGLPDLANCAHSQYEREDYLDRAWLQWRTALSLDSNNPIYRAEFVALSELLKRKPEYDGGLATEPTKNELEHFLTEHPITKSSEPSDSLASLKALEEKALAADRNHDLVATQRDVADAKETIRVQPTDGFAWGKLGRAYLHLGDYKNAEEATQKAIEIFRERAKNVPPPVFTGKDERGTDLRMLGIYYEQLAEISDKLHKKRAAARYRDSAIRALDLGNRNNF